SWTARPAERIARGARPASPPCSGRLAPTEVRADVSPTARPRRRSSLHSRRAGGAPGARRPAGEEQEGRMARGGEEAATAVDLTAADYRALAAFRYELRRFLRVSEQLIRAAGLEPQHYLLLLALRALP